MADKQDPKKIAKQTSLFLDTKIERDKKKLQRAIRKLEETILKNLHVLEVDRDGVFDTKYIKNNIAEAQKLHSKLNTIFEETYNATSKSVIYDAAIAREVKRNVSGIIGESVTYSSVDKDIISALNDNHYVGFLNLGETANVKIVDSLYTTIVAGGSLDELKNGISSALTGKLSKHGRPLVSYTDLYANDAQMEFFQTVNNKKAKDAGLTHFLYYGTIIKTTRPFCKARVGKIFSTPEIESWNSLSWKGKSGNVWANLGGFNCRHHLNAVDPDWES